MEIVIATAEATGFNKAWDIIEAAGVNGRYLDNMEMHYIDARNFEVNGGDANDFAKQHGFDDLAHMFTNVSNQALEDLELRSFEW